MNSVEFQTLQKENTYLKHRCAQLQGDVSDLGVQVVRLTEQLDRIAGRREARDRSDPLAGGH